MVEVGTMWEKVKKQSFRSPLRGDYKKEGRKSERGVGKHIEGCEIMREEKKKKRGEIKGSKG